jgi:hypothetical protein
MGRNGLTGCIPFVGAKTEKGTAMKAMSKLAAVGSAVVAGLLTMSAADAATYKFYDGNNGASYTGPYNGAGTVFNAVRFLPTDCPNGLLTCHGADVDTNPMTFTGGLTVSSPNGTVIVDDLAPSQGGLGVLTPGPTASEDQIDGAEVLNLHFNTNTVLKGVGTLFAGVHQDFGNAFPTVASVAAVASTIEFLLSVDGAAWQSVKFLDANNIALNFVGHDFSFMQKAENPQFYVSALITGPGQNIPETPIPAALPLLMGGLGVMGLGRRRKAKAAA